MAVAFVLSLLSNGIGFVSNQMAASGNVGSDAALGLVGVLGIFGLCACCFGYLAYIGVGYLYGRFAAEGGTPVETGTMAMGGALTAVAVGLLAGLCNGVFGLITGVSQMSALNGLSGSDRAAAGAVGAAGGIIGLFIGLCIAIVLSAAFGAGGGAIYAATQGNKATPAAPPPAM